MIYYASKFYRAPLKDMQANMHLRLGRPKGSYESDTEKSPVIESGAQSTALS